MTGYESKKAAAQDKLKCQCSMTTSLVGSGCQYCNPEYMDDDAQPAQEPVATLFGTLPVYDNTPPQRPWVGLTDEEVDQFHNWKDCTWSTNELVRYVEAKLKEKNT